MPPPADTASCAAVANPLDLLERIGRLQAQLPKLQADCAW